MVVWADTPHEFAAVSIHEVSEDDMVVDAPIAGGTGSVSFAAHAGGSEVVTATAAFGDRPPLTAGKRYAIVVDPTVTSETPPVGASFPMTFSSDFDYFISTQGAGGWDGSGVTGQLFFSVTLAMPAPAVEILPLAPTLNPSTQCAVPGTVDLPEQDGVSYSVSTVGEDATVTASPLDGFAFPAEAVASWVFSVAAEPCAVEPTLVTPQEPTLRPSTQCEVPGTVQLPQQDGVLFTESTVGDQTTVSAGAQPGFVFPAEARSNWAFNTGAETCAVTTPPVQPGNEKPGLTLANTGSGDSLWNSVAAGLVLLVGGALLLRRKTA